MLEILVLKANHLGFPGSTITMENAVIQLKITLAVEATYYMIVGAIKASIVDLYLRFGTSLFTPPPFPTLRIIRGSLLIDN